MKLKSNLKYIATPAKIFMTVFIVLIAVSILQGIILEIEYTFRFLATTQPKAELTQEKKRLKKIRNSAKVFLPDGTIHLVHKPRRTPGRMDESEIEQIYDANDDLLWEGPIEDQPYEYLSWAEQIHRYHEGFTNLRMKQIQMITPEFSQTLEIPVGPRQQIRQVWRYSPASDLFVGYGSNGEKIGYAGSTGFTDSKSKAEPFGEFRLFTAWCPPDSSVPTLLWQTRRRIYQINFEKQHVEPIFESTDADIKTINLHAWRNVKPGEQKHVDRQKYRPLLHCITEDGKHHLLMRNPGQQLTITIPKDWQGWANYYHRFTATKQGIFLRRNWTEFRKAPDYPQAREVLDRWLSDYQSKDKKHHVELYRLGTDGGPELLTGYTWSVPARPGPVVRARDPRPAVQRGVSQFSPPLYDVAAHLLGRKFWSRAYSSRNMGDFFYSLVRMIMDTRPYGGVINRVLSALMMGFVFLHGWPRRTSWVKFAFWLIFVGTFNLAGLFTYLDLNHTVVIKCPVCGKRRGLDRVDCVRCQVELPAPERGKLDLIFST